MPLSPSAHVDTFTRDHLPPAETWPILEFTLPELQYPDRLNAATVLIDDAVAAFGARPPGPAHPGRQHLELRRNCWHRANRVAEVLTEDFGVVPGNRVLLRGPNNPWLVAAWLGVLKAGAVVVTTMPMLRAPEVATLISLTTPVVAITDHRFAADMQEAAAGAIPVIPYGSDDDGDLLSRCAGKTGTFADVDTAADDVALLGPTSGTTGVPKVTMHFHRDILANADTFARYILAPTPEDVFAGSPPLAFTFGLGGLVVFPLRFGASSLLTEPVPPVQLAERPPRPRTPRSCSPHPPPTGPSSRPDARTCSPGCAPASRPANICPWKPGRPSGTPPGWNWWTASAPPRCCTSSSPPPARTSSPAPPAWPCPATGPSSWTRTARRRPTTSPAGWR